MITTDRTGDPGRPGDFFNAIRQQRPLRSLREGDVKRARIPVRFPAKCW